MQPAAMLLVDDSVSEDERDDRRTQRVLFERACDQLKSGRDFEFSIMRARINGPQNTHACWRAAWLITAETARALRAVIHSCVMLG